MSIPYSLEDNNFNNKGGYFARMRSHGTATLDTIATRMVEQGCPLNKSDILAVLHLFINVCIALILEGWRVNVGSLVHLYCSIEGRFESHQDLFDPTHHTLKGTATPGQRLNKALKTKGKASRRRKRVNLPNPTTFTDLRTREHRQLTPGGQASLEGSHLKINLETTDEGLFLCHPGQPDIPLEITYNTQTLLLMQFPPAHQLTAASYTLEIRKRSRQSKTLRSQQLPHQLTVNRSE